jgi:hypothetical protein
VTELRKAASLALDEYIKGQQQDGETLAMTESRLIEKRDEAYGGFYACAYGSAVAVNKAAQDGLDAALMQRAELMKRDGESVEQALARLVREGDVIVKSLYRVGHAA